MTEDKAMFTFFVAGQPKPGGSKKAFHNHKTGRIVITDDAGAPGKAWRERVSSTSAHYFGTPLEGPLAVWCTFEVLRPQSHFNSKGIVKPNAPKYPVVRPDATKLFRSTEDAMTGIVYRDDSQIVTQVIKKRYSNRVGALICVVPWDGSAFGD